MSFTRPFSQICNNDVASVGGKNASLGEMFNTLGSKGIKVPDGFAVTAAAYREFLAHNNLIAPLEAALGKLDINGLVNLAETGDVCRKLIASGSMPESIVEAVRSAFEVLLSEGQGSVAVRSSATAEDLPTASFAGQHESYLNISGFEALIHAIQKCYVSLFNDRAIKYREDNGFSHMQVALSVGVQRMVRSDLGSAGVAFTLDPETGNDNFIYLTSSWGLGENVVQGAVSPDEFFLFKPAIGKNPRPLVYKQQGSKEQRMVYATEGKSSPVKNIDTSHRERSSWSLDDQDVITLGSWCSLIETNYGMPMDIEWARDGITGELFIVQARPETVHRHQQVLAITEYRLLSSATPLWKGKAVGRAIASGPVCVVNSLADARKVKQGDIIVADITNPD